MKRLINFIIHPVNLTMLVLTFLFALPFILPKKDIIILNDNELRHRALSTKMLPIPTTYEELLKLVDNAENPMTAEKISLGKEFFLTLFFQEIKIYPVLAVTYLSRVVMTIFQQL